jgi:hypothetical protein
MKKKLLLAGTLFFIFTELSLPLTGTTLGIAQVQMKPAGTVDSARLDSVANFQCTISNIAAVEVDSNIITGENRIYVQCANSPGGGLFSFASAVGTNGGTANRYLAILNTAVALGKTVSIFYDINAINNPLGCQSADCRKLTGLVLGP